MPQYNIKQQEVIDELNQNIIVLASAGTGKTGTLAKRVASIIEKKKASPEEILCISFTNKASKEMKDRIEEMAGPPSKGVTVKTFHSWCFDIIKKQAKKQTDLFTDFIVYDEEDCKDVITEARKLIPELENRLFTESLLQRFISLVKEEMAQFKIKDQGPLEVEDIMRKIFTQNKVKIDEIAKSNPNGRTKDDQILIKRTLRMQGEELVGLYNMILGENRGVDFNDLILKTLEILQDKQLVEGIKAGYKYINIDEVQDTSNVEYYIIQKIFGESKILLCGDIFQTIYQWRGSAPEEIIEHFKKNYGPREIIFNTNYRATKNLVNLSVQYLQNAFPEKSKKHSSDTLEIESATEGSKIVVKEVYNIDDEAAYIYKQIKNSKSLENICVLSRMNYYNKELSKVMKGLQEPGDPFEFVLVDEFQFFRRKEIKDVTALMKLIANKNDAISLKRILKNFSLGIGKVTLDKIESEAYRELGIKLTDFIDHGTRQSGEPFRQLTNALKDNNIIVYDVESTGVDTTEDEIIQIAAMRIDKDGNEIERFEKVLKNSKSVGSSKAVHKFSDEYLAEHGEDRVKVLKEFVAFSKDSVIVGHNVTFDIRILESELKKNGLEGPMFTAFYDTLDIYRRFYPNEKNHKLDYLSKRFETNHKPTHDAMDDILATSELLIMAINRKIIPTSLDRMRHIEKHLGAFGEISKQLEILFYQVPKMRPAEIVKTIVVNFRMKGIYDDEKVENLRKFYFLIDEIDNKDKSNQDALLEVLKVTGLSNGEIELLMLKGRNKVSIPIITVHQAKGLEFDTVFLAGVHEKGFPTFWALQAKDLDEEKRTFYVAITRAKKNLHISYSSVGNYGRPNEKSQFLNLLCDQYLSIG